MTEEQLNKEQLRKDLKGFSYSNELLDKILELLSNQYINGLEQSRFDKRMLEYENRELRKEKQEWINLLDMFKNQQKEFIEWLEIRIKDRDKVRKMHELYSLSEEILSSQYFILQDVLSKYKEIIGSDNK